MYLKLKKVKVRTWMKRGIPEITININNIKTLTCTCITETFKKACTEVIPNLLEILRIGSCTEKKPVHQQQYNTSCTVTPRHTVEPWTQYWQCWSRGGRRGPRWITGSDQASRIGQGPYWHPLPTEGQTLCYRTKQ